LTSKHQNLLLNLHQLHKSCFCRSVSSLFHVRCVIYGRLVTVDWSNNIIRPM